MYTTVMRSYLRWFRDVKSMGRQSVGMAASSMTLGMMLNLGAIVVLVALVTPMNALDRPGFENWVIPTAVLLWGFNFLLASRQMKALPPDHPSGTVSRWHRWIGFGYLWGSLAFFMGLMIALMLRTKW
jgi:hypothetical protein